MKNANGRSQSRFVLVKKPKAGATLLHLAHESSAGAGDQVVAKAGANELLPERETTWVVLETMADWSVLKEGGPQVLETLVLGF